MKNDFIPKRPNAQEFKLYFENNFRRLETIFDEFIDQHWTEHINPIFKDVISITGYFDGKSFRQFSDLSKAGIPTNPKPTHEGIIIGINPIKEPRTDSEKLKEILDAHKNGTLTDVRLAVEKAARE